MGERLNVFTPFEEESREVEDRVFDRAQQRPQAHHSSTHGQGSDSGRRGISVNKMQYLMLIGCWQYARNSLTDYFTVL